MIFSFFPVVIPPFFLLILSILIPFLLSVILTPLIQFLSRKGGLLDIPNERKIHHSPTPNLGGVALFISFSSLSLLLANGYSLSHWGILLCGSLLVILGIFDATLPLKAWHKFSIQFLVVCLAVFYFNLSFHTVSLPGLGEIELGVWGKALSVWFLLSLINALNLIDGLDGLASGISGIAAFGLACLFLKLGHPLTALILFGVAGSTVGFWIYNRPPASVFMGDSGSMFLGFALGCGLIMGTQERTLSLHFLSLLLPLGIPIFDLCFAIVRRFYSKASLFEPDRNHIHHLLLKRGWSARRILTAAYLVTLTLSLVAYMVSL